MATPNINAALLSRTPQVSNNEAPSESVARAMEKIRRDIGNNQFRISTHANHRMVTRGISHHEMIKTVQAGVLARGKFVADHIGGRYIMGGLTVVAYAPYGDHSALPNIVTVYRDGEEDDYEVGDLDSVAEVKALKAELQAVRARTATSVDSLSFEELERLVEERVRQRAYDHAEALRAKRSELEKGIRELEGDLSKILDEMGRSPSGSIEDFERASKDFLRSSSGRVRNFVEVCRRHRLLAKSFKIWANENGFRCGNGDGAFPP